MTMPRIDHHPSQRHLAVFGLLWLVFFTAIGASVWWRSGSLHAAGAIWGLAVAVPAVGLAWPGGLRLVYLGMAYAAMPIGLVVSFLVLAVVYYGVVTPIGLLLRLAGYDAIERRFDRKAETYWTSHQQEDGVERYFRQF